MSDRRTDSHDHGRMIEDTNAAMVWPDILIVCGILSWAVIRHLSGHQVNPSIVSGALIGAGLVHAGAILWAIWMSRRMIVDNRNINRHYTRQTGAQAQADNDQPLVDEFMVNSVK